MARAEEREVSPVEARMAGLLYLAVIASGAFAEFFVRSAMIVPDDAAATAHNILANMPLYRLGFVAYLGDAAGYLFVTLVLYDLLKGVSRRYALLGVYFSLVGTAIVALNTANDFAPLLILNGASGAATQDPQALSLLFLKMHGIGYRIALSFFAVHLVLVGVLIARATFLPRLLGVLLTVAGFCYLTNCLAGFLDPGFARLLFPYILMPGLAGEIGLALWLLIAGYNRARWRAQAGVASG